MAAAEAGEDGGGPDRSDEKGGHEADQTHRSRRSRRAGAGRSHHGGERIVGTRPAMGPLTRNYSTGSDREGGADLDGARSHICAQVG